MFFTSQNKGGTKHKIIKVLILGIQVYYILFK